MKPNLRRNLVSPPHFDFHYSFYTVQKFIKGTPGKRATFRCLSAGSRLGKGPLPFVEQKILIPYLSSLEIRKVSVVLKREFLRIFLTPSSQDVFFCCLILILYFNILNIFNVLIFMYDGRAPKGELCNKVCMYVCMYVLLSGDGVKFVSYVLFRFVQ